MKSYLKVEDVEYWITTNETKANIVERAFTNLKKKLTRYSLKNQSRRWVHVLQDLAITLIVQSIPL